MKRGLLQSMWQSLQWRLRLPLPNSGLFAHRIGVLDGRHGNFTEAPQGGFRTDYAAKRRDNLMRYHFACDVYLAVYTGRAYTAFQSDSAQYLELISGDGVSAVQHADDLRCAAVLAKRIRAIYEAVQRREESVTYHCQRRYSRLSRQIASHLFGMNQSTRVSDIAENVAALLADTHFLEWSAAPQLREIEVFVHNNLP